MSLIVSLVFLAVSILFASDLRRFHFDTLLAPIVLLIPLIILLFVQVFKDIVKIRKKKALEASQEPKESSEEKKPFKLKDLVRLDAPYKVFLWLGIFMISCYLISIPLAGFIFIFLYQKFIGKERWLTSILIPLGTASFLYVVFGMFVGVDFFGTSLLLRNVGW